MRLYFEVARRGFRRYSTYVAATVAGVFTNTMFGFIQAYVLIAVLALRPGIGGFEASDAVTYTFVAQALIAAIAFWGWFEIEQRIRTGDVTTDLLRPHSFMLYWLAHDAGRALYQLLARGIPPFAIAAIFFELRLPERAVTWALFAASLPLALLVSFFIRFIVNLTGFWLLEVRGPYLMTTIAWMFLSGLAIPLPFFPGLLRKIARLSPFAACLNTPAEVLLERVRTLDALGLIGLQGLWAVALLAGACAMLGAGVRRLVIHGG